MQVFGLPCSATVRLACSFVAQTTKQPVWVLTSVSVVLDLAGSTTKFGTAEFALLFLLTVIFHPLLKYSNSFPDVHNVSMLTHVERVNRVISSLILRYSH